MQENKTEYPFIDINELKPYENNARLHPQEQIDKIVNSIKEFGFITPVIIDENNTILVGHGRTMAAKRAGLKQVPYRRITNLTDEQKRAYILADNKLSDIAEWDEELLRMELENITLDMTAFGFDDFEINLNEEPAEVVEDEVPEVPEESKVKLGDLYKLGNHRLICGDSTDEQVIERLMDGVKADMVFTDPPYGINIVNSTRKVGTDNKAKCGIYNPIIGDNTTETAKKAYNIFSQRCDKMMIWGGNYFLDFLPPSDGWLIWDKETTGNFADGEMVWCNFHTAVKIYHQLWNGMIREGEHEKRVHPTQKPIRMLSEILQDFTNEGDVILDVFGGSGSTLIACEQTGRTCNMAELSPQYVDIIINRWETLTGQKAELIKGVG